MDEAAPQAAGNMSGEDARLLNVLLMLWAGEYSAGYDEKQGWWASRDGDVGSLILAGSVVELGNAIQADSLAAYAAARGTEGTR
jgi:hypothetical protein